MPDINDILNYFQEEAIKNTFQGKFFSGEIIWENKPVLLNLQQSEAGQLLFSLNKLPIRINLSGHLNYSFNDNENAAYFRNLFWLTKFENQSVELTHISCGSGQHFTSDLEIGYGDNILLANRKTNIDKLSDDFKRDYVFSSSGLDIIFVETHPGNTTQSFTLYGHRTRADIVVIDNKWIINRIKNKPFPRKLEDFIDLNVATFKHISFLEASKASKAYETIQEEQAQGKTLISLWQQYSSIELERANQLKESLGSLQFIRQQYLSEDIVKIKIGNLNEELKNVIKEFKEDIESSLLEIQAEDESTNISLNKRFNIKRINQDFTIDLYDEDNILPERGILNVSLIGDEIVNKRRERALRNLKEPTKLITRNLLFAIEGKTEAMLEKKRKEKALTERTRKFLKDKFGIDDLFPSQKAAVEIAINTPDIAIIQGPPGTGKSTVVAAICDRLIELAEKKKVNSNSKLILVSAFQNDTVEHIANKIFTLGLPTIKIGKETQSNIRAEDELIKQIKNSIDNNLQSLSASSISFRSSKRLKDISRIYNAEKDESSAKLLIEKAIDNAELNDELWNDWNYINSDKQYHDTNSERNIKLLKGIRIDKIAYDDDGFEKIQRLLFSDIPLTEEEKQILAKAPLNNPDEVFLNKLLTIKENYLEKIAILSNLISGGNNLALSDWLDRAILYFTQKEETEYQDEETFWMANLESLREELDGNSEFIRKTIKDYAESLAATNQLAGGREISEYSIIENVILEEAARSNPLDLIIPMSKATERIIMVGDQNQLPHLIEEDVLSETIERLKARGIDAKESDLRTALFGKIFLNLKMANPRRTITLTEQFRMHPFIGDFISRVYYKDLIENGTPLKSGLINQDELKKHGLEISWAKQKVTVFCDIPKSLGKEEKKGTSKIRKAEAIRIIQILDEFKKDPSFDNLSVGIITFYSKQVDEIFCQAVIKGYAEPMHDGNYKISQQDKLTLDGREKLRIGSVDSFQGKEFDVVILSTVRSNEISRTHDNFKKVFGFLTLENRLNVAFSRAQKLLIVVGDGEMFSDDYAKTYLEGLHEFYNILSLDTTYGNRIQ